MKGMVYSPSFVSMIGYLKKSWTCFHLASDSSETISPVSELMIKYFIIMGCF